MVCPSDNRRESLAPVIVEVDTSVYSLSAIKKTCYKLASLFAARIETSPDKGATVTLLPTGTETSPADLEKAFLIELNDQDLREVVARETEGVRDLILAHALSRVPLVNSDLANADYREDPELKDLKL